MMGTEESRLEIRFGSLVGVEWGKYDVKKQNEKVGRSRRVIEPNAYLGALTSAP